MSNETVSVVIPTHDRPGSLARAVHSALQQTLPPLEVIVVADGENCATVPEDDRVRVARRAKRVGDAGAARNHGAAIARGELIAFLDDDDAWHPQKLDRQLAMLGSATATFCGFEVRSEQGRLLELHMPSTSDLREELLMRPVGQTSGLLVRKDAFRRIGGFPEDHARTEDWLLLLHLAETGEVVVQSDVLVSRTPSTATAQAQLEALIRLYVREIEPRVTPANRAGVEAHHRLIRGVLLAQTGQRRAALPLLWRSSAPWQVLRLATGEQAWSSLRQLIRGRPY